jgi:hypothetical protein
LIARSWNCIHSVGSTAPRRVEGAAALAGIDIVVVAAAAAAAVAVGIAAVHVVPVVLAVP